MEVSGQLHAPAPLTPGKEPLVPIAQETGYVPAQLLDVMEDRKFTSSTGYRFLVVESIARHFVN